MKNKLHFPWKMYPFVWWSATKKRGDLQIAQILPTALHFDPNNWQTDAMKRNVSISFDHTFCVCIKNNNTEYALEKVVLWNSMSMISCYVNMLFTWCNIVCVKSRQKKKLMQDIFKCQMKVNRTLTNNQCTNREKSI